MSAEAGQNPLGDSSSVIPERSRNIIQQLRRSTYECASCLCNIRRNVAVWSCSGCFCIFHLFCIKKWAKQGESGEGSSFRCPHCQAVQNSAVKYFCFCGKVRDPPHDAHLTPHSCGQSCGKKRPLCSHPCPLQCHPGPCPPCSTVAGPKSCPCGATTYSWRCGEPDPHKCCDNICSKLLNCSKHTCKRKCHNGECDPCPENVHISCNCELETKKLPCGSSPFSCGKVCGRKLRCGDHLCDLDCHSGSCPPCNRDPSIIVTCPCGSVPLTQIRNHCSDPIPTCGGVCGRVLDCQRHTCQSFCHEGVCEPCKQRALTKCICGATQQSVLCSKQDGFSCGQVCQTWLSCGKHKCRVACCPERKNANSTVHHCNKICNKKLPCGHTCLETCHRGMCPSCVHVIPERLVCRCGAQVLMPPQPCGTPPPKCTQPCTLPLPCSHPVTNHSCHYGDCPPCMFPVEKLCVGGHTVVKNVPCSSTFICCSSKCDKPLTCGHKCSRFCHPGPCVEPHHPCVQPCGKIHTDCGHICKAKCHPSKECPQCSESQEHRCQCGRQAKRVSCKKYLQMMSDHPGEKLNFDCNANCLYEQRLAILASRSSKSSIPSPPTVMKYSLFLWEFGVKNLSWIRSIEDELARFVSSTSPLSCLKPMTAEKRRAVHSLCHYYHIRSESVDAEPNRSCLLIRTPKTSRPTPLLSSALEEGYSEKHDPLIFINGIRDHAELMCEHVIFTCGENLNPILISNLLQDYAGEFVYEEEEETLTDGKKRIGLYFIHPSKRQQAYSLFRSVRPPFEFSIPSQSGEENLKSSIPCSSTSWAQLASSKKRK